MLILLIRRFTAFFVTKKAFIRDEGFYFFSNKQTTFYRQRIWYSLTACLFHTKKL